VESASIRHTAQAPGLRPGLPLRGPTPLLRLQSDERLVALVRRGHNGAFEALVSRYHARLLAFCRHMLSSKEDAEDVLQEVFTAAYNAMLGDNREINVRPWLYRIARNRSLNHLRRAQAIGVDSMDIHFAEGGQSTGDKVFKREEFRLLVGDVQRLPETQRTALLLREIDDLSYEQIAEAMETTVPAVKSLLVRARVSLAEASEARRMSCDEVRLELGAVAEGISKMSAPVRRHVKECHRCDEFRGLLRTNNRALAAVMPVGPLLLLKKLVLVHLGTTASHSAGAAGGAAAASSASSAAISAGAGAVATKAAAGLAAAALVTAGAVEVQHVKQAPHAPAPVARVAASPRPAPGPAPVIVKAHAQPVTTKAATPEKPVPEKAAATTPAQDAPATTVLTVAAPVTQQDSDTTVLPGTADAGSNPPATPPSDVPPPSDQAPPPSDSTVPPPDSGTPSSDPSDPNATPTGDPAATPPADTTEPPPSDGSDSPPPPPPE
jgi:RNA polymerase sigma factor (sigma-70 family)